MDKSRSGKTEIARGSRPNLGTLLSLFRVGQDTRVRFFGLFLFFFSVYLGNRNHFGDQQEAPSPSFCR